MGFPVRGFEKEVILMSRFLCVVVVVWFSSCASRLSSGIGGSYNQSDLSVDGEGVCVVHRQGVKDCDAWVLMRAFGVEVWPSPWSLAIAEDGCVVVRGGWSHEVQMHYSLAEKLDYIKGVLSDFDWSFVPAEIGQACPHASKRFVRVATEGDVHRIAIYENRNEDISWGEVRGYLLWDWLEGMNRMKGIVRFQEHDLVYLLGKGDPPWFGPAAPVDE